MAVIAVATADLDDLAQLSAYHTTYTTISTLQARTGTRSFRCASNTGVLTLAFPPRASIYIRFAVFRTGIGRTAVRFRDTGTTRGQLFFQMSAITGYIGTGTTVGLVNYVDNHYLARWQVYECYYLPHASAGVMTLKVNGQQVSTFSGKTSAATGNINEIHFTHITDTQTYYLDDILVDDANWPGLGGIEVIRPDGDGTDQEWDSGDYTDVNDDNDSTYVATDAAVAAKQSFTIPALAADRHTPKAVGIFTKSQLSGVGAGTLKPYPDGQPVALSTNLQWTKDFRVAYPSEVGLEVIV